MHRKRRRRSVLDRMVHEVSGHVLLESTRASIEKMAEEFAREMLSDPVFRQQLRDDARRAAREIAESMRKSA